MIKLAFIGAGRHASLNLYPSALICNAKIIAVATRSITTAENAIRRFGLSDAIAYDDHKKMLENNEIDAVVISTGIDNQLDIVLDVIKARKPFLVEKPLGLSKKEAEKVALLADEYNVTGFVAFMKRFAPAHTMLKEAVECKIGTVLSFNAMMSVDCSQFVNSDEMMLKCAMIHYLDLARYIFGKVTDVRGFSHNLDDSTNLCFSILFESGVCGNMYFSSNKAWSSHEEFITVTGEYGTAKVSDFSKFTLHQLSDNDGDWQRPSECELIYRPANSTMSGGEKDLYINGFVGEMQYFIHCVTNNIIPHNNLWDNVETMQACDDVIEACHLIK